MRKPLDIGRGVWFRFSEYQIKNGFICPAERAVLERYDPWSKYKTGRWDGDSPHGSLLNLLQSLHFQPIGTHNFPDGGYGQYLPTKESEVAIIRWVEKYGLLGVLLNRVRSVTLAPRWEYLMPSPDEASAGTPLTPLSNVYTRTSTGWQHRGSQQVVFAGGKKAATPMVVNRGELRGNLVEEEYWGKGAPTPGASIRKLDSHTWEDQPLTKTWSRFFPSVPAEERETYLYPMPITEEFWALYSEPVFDFIHGAKALFEAVAGLEAMKPLSKLSDKDGRRVAKGRQTLHALTESVHATLSPQDNGTFRMGWVASSLLGSFSMMALLDLTEGQRVFHCANCGALATSSAPGAQYCSDTCRHTAQKRAYRQRQADALRLHGEGASVEAIAELLGSKPETVAGWIKRHTKKEE